MFSPADAIRRIEAYVSWQTKLEQDRKDLLNSPDPPDVRDERDVALKAQIDDVSRKKEQVLRAFLTFPPFHDRHRGVLEAFLEDGAFEKSVFIMTKYPDGGQPDDAALQNVIDTVKNAVLRCNHQPRLALDRDYHPSLWDNVELHLLGCTRGIAIVESKYRPELNPNIAMEWVWMRGMGRDVLYLVERAFNQKRADWGGLIEYSFAWDDPAADIVAAVHKWLKCPLNH